MTDVRDYAGRWLPPSMRTSHEALRWWLETLYAPCTGADLFCELRPVPTWEQNLAKNRGADPLRIWWPIGTPEQIGRLADLTLRTDQIVGRRKSHRTGHPGQIYYAVQPRRDKGGKKDDVQGFVAVYADLELRKGGVEPSHAARSLSTLPTPPSALVWSGNGMHAYWLFDRLVGRIDLERVEALVRGIAHRLQPLHSDPAVKDASRILRLPGTHNRKRGEVAVELLALHPGRRYRLWELENHFPVPSAPPVAPARLQLTALDFDAPEPVWIGQYHPSVLRHLARCRGLGATDSALDVEARRCAALWGRRDRVSEKHALSVVQWMRGRPVGQPRRRRLRPPARYTAEE